jgi:hypothetical protein
VAPCACLCLTEPGLNRWLPVVGVSGAMVRSKSIGLAITASQAPTKTAVWAANLASRDVTVQGSTVKTYPEYAASVHRGRTKISVAKPAAR